MKFIPAPLEGAYLIDIEKLEDERGFFGRAFCAKDFAEQGLESSFIQMNDSYSVKKGTLRGLHYQLPPMQETKIVRCVRGSCFDVILDLRKDSKTFGSYFGEILSAENRHMMYVPKGFAHGFLTLEDETELIYMVSQYYSPENERGIRWDDPTFAIRWPGRPTVLSKRDLSHKDFHIQEAL